MSKKSTEQNPVGPSAEEVEVAIVEKSEGLPARGVEAEESNAPAAKVTPRRAAKNSGNVVIIVTVLAVLTVLAGLAVWWGVESRYTDVPESSETFSNTVCEPFTEAGLVCSHETEFSDTVAEGKLISQSLAVGERVERDTAVVLVFSDGPEMVEVPDIYGNKLDSAKEKLNEAGFGEVTVEEVADTGEAYGVVVGSSLEPGSSHRIGSDVLLSVSDGKVVIPDVVGLTSEQAQTDISSVGVALQVLVVSSTETPGMVIDQSPAAGRIGMDETVVITVSSIELPEQLVVPDVVGSTPQDAQIELATLGFTQISVVTTESDSVEEAFVTETVPSAGRSVSSAENIVLVVTEPLS